MLEQLLLYGSKPIMYHGNLVLAQALMLLYNCNEKVELEAMQLKILSSTTLLLLNLITILSSTSIRQQRLASSVASLIIVGNQNCCSLMQRIFPKRILKKVDAEKSYTDWKPEHWKEFFVLIQSNYNTSTEQWDEECREELIAKLRISALGYLKGKYMSQEGERPKWNYDEYEVIYSTLESKCVVGKYYLTEILSYDEANVPYLKEKLKKPISFWRVKYKIKK